MSNSKYQEAKDNIVNTLARQIDYKTYKNLYSKDFDTLQELVDKATPKKPVRVCCEPEEEWDKEEQLKRVIDKAKELSDSNDELERTIHSLDCELSDVYNPKPYKFEDLKPNMWVWDNVAKECLYVIKFFAAPFTGAKYFSYLGIYKNLEEIKKLDIKFEENRFFPVQCANLES